MSTDKRCPKCRALGLDTDCADQLLMIPEDGRYDLEVTITFTTPVTSTLDKDPHDMATYMREKWINNESELQEVLLESVFADYDLTVRPAFTL